MKFKDFQEPEVFSRNLKALKKRVKNIQGISRTCENPGC